ncbi:hypothetical protein SteCoe_6140 [Stentor coeruleus]|uniref:Uncharacterized protein n=1 Tax=Stentor coeruleus TaxID=5963 RepID=A0A1R2CQT0_9CILI|nr:hypothetical protein SteCoe_6140 [Stentor coeruleus]
MVIVIDADKGRVLQEKLNTDSISSIISQAAKSMMIEENKIFIISSEGYYCEDSALVSHYITGEDQFLVVLRKDKVNLEFPIVKADWNTFNNFPRVEIISEPFSFPSEYSTLYSEIMLTYERLLFSLSKSMVNTYAQYRTSLEYISESSLVLRNRLKSSQAILNTCSLYLNSVKTIFSSIEHRLYDLNSYLGQKKDNFLSNVNSLISLWNLSQTQAENLIAFPSALAAKYEILRTKLRTCQRKFNEIEKEKDRELDSLSKLEFGIENALSQANPRLLHDHEGLFMENFRVCRVYSRYSNHLAMIQIPNLDSHELRNIEQRLEKEREKQITYFSNNDASMKRILQDCEIFEKTINERIVAMNRFYKNYVNFSHKCSFKVKAVFKHKLDKYLMVLKKLEENSKILEVHSIVFDPQKALEQDVNSLGRLKSEKFFEIIQKFLAEEAESQKKFLDTYGKIIPMRAVKSIYNYPIKVCKHTNDLLKRSYDSNLKTELMQAPEVSKDQIHKFYKKLIKTQQESFACSMNNLNTEISILNKSIESTDTEIKEISEQKEHLLKIILNFDDELSIMKNGHKEVEERSKNLRLFDLEYKKRLENILTNVKEKNKKLNEEIRKREIF